MSAVFLTGATGLLGQYLLRDLLIAGKRVAVLVRRASDRLPSRSRVDAVLRRFEQQFGRTLPRPTVVEGHLDEDDLGLAATDRQWVTRNCSSVLHCAASIQFQRSLDDDEPYHSNVQGTRRLLDFCSQVGLREFHYVSTAYVCGDRRGTILESEFDLQQGFRNDYEQSKFSAEELLRSATLLDSLTIYRPSIVVGDFSTGYTSTFHGFYLPLQLVHAAAAAGFIPADQLEYREALRLRGHEHKNLVPVDWVSATLVQILSRPGNHGKTYHLTNPQPVTTGSIGAAISDAVYESVAMRTKTRNTHPVSQKQIDEFRERMEVYSAYLSNDPEFDCQHTLAAAELPCPRLDHADLVRLAKYAIDANFGWARPRPTPAELDVAALLDKLPTADALGHPALRLEVSGSCGGSWIIGFSGGTPTIVNSPNADLCAYFNVHTMRHILQGKQSILDSLADGRIILQAVGDQISAGPVLLEALFSRLQGSQ